MQVKRLSALLITLTIVVFGNNISAATKKKQEGYVNVNGGKIYYATYGEKNASPIIVLHGGPGLDHGYLLPQMLDLARDHQVTFYDQRACGKSLGFTLDSKTINIQAFVDDLEAVRKQLGYDKIILLGHSWGGLLAMNYAIQHPDKLQSLVLLDSAPATSNSFTLFLNEYVKRTTPLRPELEKIERSAKFKEYDAETINDYYRKIFAVYFYKPALAQNLSLDFTQESAKSGLNLFAFFEQSYYKNYNLKSALQKLQLPVLIVHGQTDIVPIATAYEIKDFIPNSKIVVLQKCDHFPYIEQPKKFFAAIREFID